jgi:hypothetical protein
VPTAIGTRNRFDFCFATIIVKLFDFRLYAAVSIW